MEEPTRKMHYFVDESGDPNFFDRRKNDLLAKGLASRYFMVGYLELADLNALAKKFAAIRDEIGKDEFINVIPSVEHSLFLLPREQGLPRGTGTGFQDFKGNGFFLLRRGHGEAGRPIHREIRR